MSFFKTGFFVLFISLITLPVTEAASCDFQEKSDFLSRIYRHPALITIRLRKALNHLVNSPETILKMGIKPIEGDNEKYKLLLKYILRNSGMTDVSFHGYDPLAIGDGKLGGITLVVSNISMKPLSFESLTISMKGITFDVDALISSNLFVLKNIDNFSFKTIVTDTVLGRLAGSGVSLKVCKGKLHISTTVKLLLFQMVARVSGTLLVRDGESICFSADSLNVGNLPFADFFKNKVSASINPLFSLNKYMGKARMVVDTALSSVSAEDGFIVISGEGRIALCK